MVGEGAGVSERELGWLGRELRCMRVKVGVVGEGVDISG